MNEFKKGRVVTSVTLPDDGCSWDFAGDEPAKIVLEDGQMSLVPWIRYVFHGQVTMINVAMCATITFEAKE